MLGQLTRGSCAAARILSLWRLSFENHVVDLRRHKMCLASHVLRREAGLDDIIGIAMQTTA
ncbi:MAG: hypothetical protein H6871_01290 [Methylobacteriaceae bacterium]|nr:hypothetical protein [Methylobacteriaceae bacterium]MCC0001713.1 hypothetical protein [Methylobacteriaceae bacterium]